MERKQRVINALNHKETDIIPYHIDFTEQEHQIMADYLKDKDFEEKLGVHLHYIQYWGWPTERQDKKGHFVDAYGVEWNRSGVDKDIGVIDHPIIADISERTYKFPPIDHKRIEADMERMLEGKEDKFTMGAIGFSVFERAWSLLSMEEVFVAMLTEPQKLSKLFDDICEYNLEVMNTMLKYPIDGFYFGDDWGQQKGLMMGADNWRKYIKPVMKKLYANAKSKGKFVLQHSCGDISEIFPDLIEIGLDCYQTFQPEIYDIEKIKNEYGNNLCFWGGISTQRLLPYETPEVVKSETKRILEIMSKGGGYIAAPTHAIPLDVPPQNVLAMLEVFENQK
jgi:uroporphyrinogen decarboxylase